MLHIPCIKDQRIQVNLKEVLNEKKRYLMIVCLLSSLVFINVEASDGGSSSVGIEFYQNPRTPAPKDAPPKTDARC